MIRRGDEADVLAVVLDVGVDEGAEGQHVEAALAVHLAPGAEGLAKHGKLAARLRIASADAAGNSATRTVAITLRIPHP